MKRLISTLSACGLAYALGSMGCSSGAAPVADDPDASSSADAAGDDGGPAGGDAGPSAYSGGDVVVSIEQGDAGDGGAADGGSAGGAVRGKVTIHMVPATPAAISKIEALVDGNVVGSATSSPFDVAWESATVSNGPHTVSARPYDLAGVSGTSPSLAITTSNFLLAGSWKWSGVTDAIGANVGPCADKTFTVTFNTQTSTMTLPQIKLSCTAQNGAPYTATVNGFSKVLSPSQYDGPITNVAGTVTTTFSSTSLRQVNSFNNNVQSGKLTKQP